MAAREDAARLANRSCFTYAPARRSLSLRITDQGAPAVVTDPERVQRVLENLVDNAVKCTLEGGQVEVATSSTTDGGVKLEVIDDGPGIGPEHLEQAAPLRACRSAAHALRALAAPLRELPARSSC